jgi:adenosylhomocysteine nucleosidase
MGSMETIGIIAAISQETQALLQRIGQWERIPLGPFHAYRFRLLERDCLLIESGMGIQRAANAARALLAVADPQFFISFGVAGAVEDDLQVGDVVIASKTCILDQGIPGQFYRLASFSDAARRAAAQALELRGARYYSGTAITTPGSQIVLQQSQTIEHPVLEMETAGIAQVLEEKGIPLLSVRAISDCPREPIPFDLNGTTDEEGSLRLGRLILMVMRQPKILFQSRRLLRNVRRAAANAAIALTAALQQPVVLASENHTNP